MTLESDCEGSIDSLDLLLAKLVNKGVLDATELRPPSAETRPAAKHTHALDEKLTEALAEASTGLLHRQMEWQRRMRCWPR